VPLAAIGPEPFGVEVVRNDHAWLHAIRTPVSGVADRQACAVC
jgi:hypothetical protein